MRLSRLSWRIRLASAIVCVFLSTPGRADSWCSLKSAPMDAAVSENHGMYSFVYPRTLTPSFAGWQTMWDELGRKVFVLTFTDGELRQYSFSDYSRGFKTHRCKYEGGKAMGNGGAEACPQYDSLKHGMLTAPADQEPSVPKERDPRLR
jgi:hypothetical protein